MSINAVRVSYMDFLVVSYMEQAHTNSYACGMALQRSTLVQCRFIWDGHPITKWNQRVNPHSFHVFVLQGAASGCNRHREQNK